MTISTPRMAARLMIFTAIVVCSVLAMQARAHATMVTSAPAVAPPALPSVNVRHHDMLQTQTFIARLGLSLGMRIKLQGSEQVAWYWPSPTSKGDLRMNVFYLEPQGHHVKVIADGMIVSRNTGLPEDVPQARPELSKMLHNIEHADAKRGFWNAVERTLPPLDTSNR